MIPKGGVSVNRKTGERMYVLRDLVILTGGGIPDSYAAGLEPDDEPEDMAFYWLFESLRGEVSP